MSQDSFVSAVRADGTFGAVFERDDDTAYFYLVNMANRDGQKIVDAFNVTNCTPLHIEVSVRWSLDERLAGLFSGKRLLAVFEIGTDSAPSKHGRMARPSDIEGFG